MPGYEEAKKAMEEYLKKVCPDVNERVCGTDGVTHTNSCYLGVASCKNPDKNIALVSNDNRLFKAIINPSTLKIQNYVSV
ncbi:uncharacterized protein PITG_11899 [Phytophthora infestans T30-4]|uniref:Kazal-like domain-containing protein n=1 Tax=Phytophthora infestans (strain T30-4) TaxID=403677 RepID=D0NHH6_PHYIT|nr:uncharacterized protein PITG_11899 [Phytophthora infestans T30-4]EEY58901.1 hypothetical protein PITG_11899 [Phytophthora infestans T30-4]|eukprot:XP_002901374.1 hypothetical protein PITG_11899 [Phytophthora infestans T30-4]